MLSAAEIESFQRFSDLESMWPLSSEYLSETVEPTLRDSMGSDEEAQQLPVFPAPYEDRPLSTEYIMGIQSPPPSALTKETGLPPRLGMEITAFDPDYTPGDGRLPGSMFHDDFRAAASDLPPGALGAHGYGGAQLAARLPSARLPPAELWADVDEPEFVRTGGGPALPTLIQPPPAPPSRRFGSSLDKNSFDTALRAGRAKSGQAPSLARRQTSETLFEETVATLPAGVPASMTPEGASLTIRSPPDVTISSGDYPQNTSFNTLERSARPPVRDQRDVVHESALGASARLGSLSSSGGATQPHAVSSSGSSASFGSTGRRALASTAQLSAAAGPEFYPVVSGGGVLVEDVIQSLEDRERQRFHHQELIRQHEDTMATPLPVAGTPRPVSVFHDVDQIMTPRLCAALKSKLAAHEAGPATLSVPQTTIWVVKDTLRTALGLEFASERPLILKSVTIPSPAYLAGAGAFESRVLRAVNGTVVNTVTDLRRAIESAQIIQLSFTSQSYCRTTEPSGQAGDNLFHNSPPCNPQPAETPPRELFTQECAGITEQQRLISGPVASGRPESLPGEYRRDTSLPAVCSELGEPACKSPTGWCAGRTSCVPSLEERAKRFADLVAGPPPPEFCDVRPPSRLSQPASDPGRDPAPRSASNVGECPPALEARLERHEASDRSRIADSECAAWIALVGDIVSRARAAPFSFAENPPSCPDNLPVFNNARPVYNPRPQFVTPASFRDSPDLPPASLPPSQPPSPRQWVRVQAENGIEGVQWVKR